jgi:hypothetical protein
VIGLKYKIRERLASGCVGEFAVYSVCHQFSALSALTLTPYRIYIQFTIKLMVYISMKQPRAAIFFFRNDQFNNELSDSEQRQRRRRGRGENIKLNCTSHQLIGIKFISLTKLHHKFASSSSTSLACLFVKSSREAM